MSIFFDKVILATGSTGSWGQELVKQLLLQNPKEIRIYSRNEFNQVSMERTFNDKRLKFIIGDVRDYDELNYACTGVDYVFHLAAIKHVPKAEEFPYEAIKTNIHGTENTIKAAINNNVKRVIDVSTDKACAPINLYGATKMVGERLILHANTLGTKTEFSIIRGGNVLGTAGSAIPYFIDCIKKYNYVPITSTAMTRYFITLSEAIQLLFVAAEFKQSGGIYVMKMPAAKMTDIAEVLIECYGNKETQIKEIGIRPGEKIHEVLISKDESPNAYMYSDSYYFLHNQNLGFPKVTFSQYSSDSFLMSKEEIKTLLEKGGFLQ